MTRVARSNPKVNSNSPLSITRTGAVLVLVRNLTEEHHHPVSLDSLIQAAILRYDLGTKNPAEVEAAIDILALQKKISLEVHQASGTVNVRFLGALPPDVAGESRESDR